MKHFLMVMFWLAPAAVWGFQEKKESQPEPRVTRIVQVQHLTGENIHRVQSLLMPFGGTVMSDPDLRTFTLSGSEPVVKAMEDTIRRMDRPPAPKKNIEVTLHIVAASPKAGESKVVPELEGVIKQLRGVFPYQSYRVLDTQVARLRDGSTGGTGTTELTGKLPDLSGVNNPHQYQSRIRASISEDSAGRRIRFDEFRFMTRRGTNMDDVNIGTQLDVREGQKAVVGKANIDQENALFIVVSAKIVD